MSRSDGRIVDPMPASAASTTQIDDVDRGIIDALIDDGRMSLTDIADRVSISRSTAHARLQRLRDTGVITGFTATVDPGARGLGVGAIILLDIDQHDWSSLRDQLVAIPGVEHLAMCAGRFDLMMVVRAASIAVLRDVLLQQVQRIEGVRSTETIIILDEARPGR